MALDQYLTLENLGPVIAGTTVFLLALARFKRQPPSAPPPSMLQPSPARLWETVKTLAQPGKPGLIQIPSPSRANTTFYSFWLYRIIYATSALAVFTLVYAVPGLRDLIKQVIGFIPGIGDTSNYEMLGPLALAFVIAGIAPIPFSGIEEAFRRLCYQRAMIDARQIRETARLKEAKYQGENLFEDGKCLEGKAADRVWRKLEAEGFNRDDLVYDPELPTAQSMWMQASLLMVHIEAWQARRKYINTFPTLMEADGVTRTIKKVETHYELLKDKAKACFENLRKPQGRAEPEICRQFRRECQEILGSIFSLLARASLAAHINDKERIECMGEIGFELKPSALGPMPDENDLGALAVLLGVMLLAPIGLIHGEFLKPFVIYMMVFVTVLTPIIIAHKYPHFAMKEGNYGPALAFPLLAGGIAMALHSSLAFAFMLDGSITERLAAYGGRVPPWAAYVFVISVLIALRMRTGTYPDRTKPEGQGWRAWGNVRDGLYLATAGAAVVLFFFLQAALAPAPDIPLPKTWGKVIIPPIVAFAVGFIIPTWYRAKLKKLKDGRDAPSAPLAPRADPRPPTQLLHSSNP